jgi:hypothetical protein
MATTPSIVTLAGWIMMKLAPTWSLIIVLPVSAIVNASTVCCSAIEIF